MASSPIFRQLFDKDSSTYTYLLADPATKEAVLIDPVIVSNATGQAVSVWPDGAALVAAWELRDATSGVASVLVSVSASPSPPPLSELEAEMTPLEGAPLTGATWSLSPPLDVEGTFWLHLCAVDFVGNSACGAPYEFVLDLTPPVTSLSERVHYVAITITRCQSGAPVAPAASASRTSSASYAAA